MTEIKDVTPEIDLVFSVLGREILETKRTNGWVCTAPVDWEQDETQIPADLCLIHSEVSEALEAFRKDDRQGFIEEMADVIIRVVGLTAGLEMDLAEAVLLKLAKNRVRGYRHGGKRL